MADVGSSPTIKVALNNNPRCRSQLTSSVKRETWAGENVPSITVEGSGFPDGTQLFKVFSGGGLIAESEVEVVSGQFEKRVELPAPLDRPREIEVRVGSEFRQVHPVRLYRLWGRLTSFTGDPIAEPIINASCGAGAVGDADGYYSIVLDGPTQHVAVFDKGYSFSTLETWLYDLDLGADTPLDIRIGSLEVYELGGWLAYGGAYLHFIPMSLHRILPLVQQGLTEQDLVARPEIWPHLSAKDVKVFIEGQEVPIATFSEYQDFLGEREGTKLTRPGYIVGITREHWRPGAVRVEVSHGCEYEGKQIMERGEGYFLGFR